MWSKIQKRFFPARKHRETLRLIIDRAEGKCQDEISSDRLEELLRDCKALSENSKTPDNGWRLKLRSPTNEIVSDEIVGPASGDSVAIGTIRATCDFLQKAGMTPENVADFLS